MTREQAILDLDRQRREAMTGADAVTLSELFSDDLMWIHATGKVDNKAAVVETIGSKATIYESIRVENESLRFVGDVAFLTGIAHMNLVSRGTPKELQNRFTIVWAPAGDSYEVVSWQSTAIRA